MKTVNPASRLVVGAAALLLAVAGVQAQTVYRIVGPDGRITFSDKPPAEATSATAQTAATRPTAARAGDTGNLPYELRQVVARFPVTLYSGAGCAPCTSGRLLLQARGVPFTEYLISNNEDIEALQRLSGARSLPFLTIGGQKIKGFAEAEWTQFLNAANYPASSQLPASYRNPEPKPLVAVEKVAPPAEPTEARDAPADPTTAAAPVPAPVPPAPSNPAGIKF